MSEKENKVGRKGGNFNVISYKSGGIMLEFGNRK